MRINLFRKPKHRQYGYVPMYYNPDKEALEERLKRAATMADPSPEGSKARISAGLKRQVRTDAYKSERSKALFRSNMMLFVILILLIFGAVYIAEVYLPELMDAFGG